jgi:hypothetical protein
MSLMHATFSALIIRVVPVNGNRFN